MNINEISYITSTSDRISNVWPTHLNANNNIYMYGQVDVLSGYTKIKPDGSKKLTFEEKVLDLEYDVEELVKEQTKLNLEHANLVFDLEHKMNLLKNQLKEAEQLVKRLETVFNKPGAQIVFDNGRIEDPVRLIQVDL